jgi:glycosyltransferase involved in cell wall biosynthesis
MDFKNIHLIIESLAKLKQQGTILSCSIIGRGPARPKLQRLAKRLEVDSQIEWLGSLDRSADVYAYMKSSKVFVLPSKREGFGIVAIEANASGMPVLTADYAGNAAKELIQDGVNGYVFEPTSDGLTATLQKTFKDLKSLERSTLDYAKAYDWDNLSHDLAGIYAP